MKRFPYAHATHPQWGMACALVLAQLRGQMSSPEFANAPSLGLLYITDHFASEAEEILAYLGAELPLVTDWSGTVGVGIASNNVEYFDEPALVVMLLDIAADQYRVFSGVAPLNLGFEAQTALVHADGNTPQIAELLEEMAERTDSGYLFGGLSSSRGDAFQFAVAGDGNIRGHGAATGVFSGGLSGVAFGPEVALLSRVTQGCTPVAPAHAVTAADHNLVLMLDGKPALDTLLADLEISLDQPQHALEVVRATLVGLAKPGPDGLSDAVRQTGNFGADVTVRHIIGLDPLRHGIAVSDHLQVGSQLVFCQRSVQAAKADLVRICAELREEMECQDSSHAVLASSTNAQAYGAPSSRHMVGAIYVSCAGRGGDHFGGPSAELHILRRALGDVPLAGFFAGGEIANKNLYGYTGVLTVFVADG